MRILMVFFLAVCCWAEARSVAITIDDLPFAQSGPHACDWQTLQSRTRSLLRALSESKTPLTAFVIGKNCPELTFEQRRAILRQWQDAGATLGNHTFSHRSLNQIPVEEYEQDILREERELRVITGKPTRWFRSPFLQTGATLAAKQDLENFLASHGYRQGVVTLDNSDWLFANVYADALDRGDHVLVKRIRTEYIPYLESIVTFFERRSREVIGYEPPQVLLLHANRLNTDFMPKILALFRSRGYRFVTLDEATADPAYRTPDTRAIPQGISWIRRWAISKGLPDEIEPDEPKWLLEAFAAFTKRGG